MAKLDQRRINFVKSLSMDVKAKVLYEFLKKGTSTRNIEVLIEELNEEDGWQAWSVIHYYGFDKHSKGKKPNLTLRLLKNNLEELNESGFEELHLGSDSDVQEKMVNIIMHENDGKDVFRIIKARQGQFKLRRLLIQNYQSRCALCEISHPKLLITSHIKSWAESSKEERIDPRNGILLCKLHDGLFEHGFISLSDSFEVLFALNFNFEEQGIPKEMIFVSPLCQAPSSVFLKEHRQKHGFE